MGGIKKLAGETLWYGVPTIFTRFLSYALSLLAFRYGAKTTSGLTLIYSIIPFLNVLFTYGLETSFFRYTSKYDKDKVYNTLSISIIASTLLFTGILFLSKNSLIHFFQLDANPQFVSWMIWILFFDTLSVLPFAKLREQGRPKKYAFLKIINIVINVLFVLFFTIICERIQKSNPNSAWLRFYNPEMKVGYFILANLVASAINLLMLYKEIGALRFAFDKSLWKEVLNYSYPLIIVGFGGQINEMLSRIMYKRIMPIDSEEAERRLGIFGANYKLAVLITIFIQIFKLAAEPFFFKKAADTDAQKTYARVMKFFVIACCFMWLVVGLYLDVWKLLITYKHQEYGEGIAVVPIIAMGGVFLGIYYNLSVWYRLTNKNRMGAYITIMGAVITIALNYILIPRFDYIGAAWATFACYAYMMIVSYYQGQKHYPIPYKVKKLAAYLAITVVLFFLHRGLLALWHNAWFGFISGTFILLAFTWFILLVEKNEFVKFPFIGKWVAKL